MDHTIVVLLRWSQLLGQLPQYLKRGKRTKRIVRAESRLARLPETHDSPSRILPGSGLEV